MNPEQLNSARLARWSQNGEAKLTLEAAAEWLDGIGFCRYLPSGDALPSLLEAVVGRPAPVPSTGEISRAGELLARMAESSVAVPLKLQPGAGDRPDWLASREAFCYVYALRGNRNFKGEPPTSGNEKVTTLAAHAWRAIQTQGPMDASSIGSILGQDITEAAVLRALHELWTNLYVFPIATATGSPPKWELTSRGFSKEVAAGACTAHAQAQSALISLYLHGVVAAPEEDVLTALTPFASQSKLREALRGLGSTRQLDMIDVGGRACICLQGDLLLETTATQPEPRLTQPVLEMAAAASRSAASQAEKTPRASNRQPPRAVRAPGKFQKEKRFGFRKFVPRDRQSKPDRPRFGEQRPEWRKSGDRPPRQQKSGYAAGFGSSQKFRASKPDRNRSQSFGDKPWKKSKTFSDRRPMPDRAEPGNRARPWDKTREDKRSSGWKPRQERSEGTKPFRGDRSRPWQPGRGQFEGSQRDQEPSRQRGKRISDGPKKRPWRNQGAASGKPASDRRNPGGPRRFDERPSERKPWNKRPSNKPGEFRSRRFPSPEVASRESGARESGSVDTRRGGNRPVDRKPWSKRNASPGKPRGQRSAGAPYRPRFAGKPAGRDRGGKKK